LIVYAYIAKSNSQHSERSARQVAGNHVPSANPSVRDRVNAVNGMLCNSQGTRRLFIDPRCRRLIHDLERVSWKADGYGNLCAQLDKSDPELTHVSDALGYLVEREFGLRVATGLRPEFIG
jgi:hypothetical protein